MASFARSRSVDPRTDRQNRGSEDEEITKDSQQTELLAQALAAYDGGRSTTIRAIWSEVLAEVLDASNPPGNLRELRDALDALAARGRNGRVFHDLSLLVREQAQLDGERTFASFIESQGLADSPN